MVGKSDKKDIAGYEFVNTINKDGVTTHIYKVKLHETQSQPEGATPDRGQGGVGQQGGGAAGEVVDPSQNLGSVSGAAAAQNVDFGQTPAVTQLSAKPEEAKPAKAKSEELASTGMNSSSTTALGLSLIGLIGLAVRRKLSK